MDNLMGRVLFSTSSSGNFLLLEALVKLKAKLLTPPKSPGFSPDQFDKTFSVDPNLIKKDTNK